MHFSWTFKIGVGLLIGAWLAVGSNFAGNALINPKPLEKSAYNVLGDGSSEKAEDTKAAAPAAAQDALALLASADAGAGEKLFKKCKACHTREEGGKNGVGPNLWEIVGRAKGGVDGFKYSKPMLEKGGDWTFADLDAFLANPKGYLKGTKMSYAGLKKAGDRAAMVLYLRSLSASPKPLP